MTYKQYQDFFKNEVGDIYKYGGTYRFKTLAGTTRSYKTKAAAKAQRTRYINQASQYMEDYDAETEEMARGKESMTYDEIGHTGYVNLYKNKAGSEALNDSDGLDGDESECCLVWMFLGFKQAGGSRFEVNRCDEIDPDEEFNDSISINKILFESDYEARYFPLHDEWRIMPI